MGYPPDADEHEPIEGWELTVMGKGGKQRVVPVPQDGIGELSRYLVVGRHVMAASKLHADDTPVPVRALGCGKTKMARLWVYVRDDRPAACTLVRSYGHKQEFITPHCPQQNGMIERVIRTLKEQCVYRYRFETLQHASRAIRDCIGFYNTRRPHQALGMKTAAEAYALAA